MSIRLAQALAIRRATVRSVRWPPALAAVLLVAALMTWRHASFDDLGSALVGLRGIALILAVGAMFVLDDAAERSVAAAPTPLWWRRLLRLSVPALFVLPVWAATLSYAHAQRSDLPWLRLTLEMFALLALGLAVGSAAVRWWAAIEPGMTAALTLLGFTFIASHLPPRFALFTGPDTASWNWSTLRWWSLLAAGVAMLGLTMRDPARRGRVRRP